ncbi:MAG: UDP-N-acetylmuramate--L-alanine ligase [FCB group bacterium]|nr:UDP-N-acetylmuramate--L-alanine ligase [FCB group bacterium]
MFGKTNHIHFVGIGGIGMSGMAELLHHLDFRISGSDKNRSEQTNRLETLGITVTIGHDPEKLPDCDVLVYSSAVRLDNPELQEARRRNIPVIRRAEMLGELMKVKSTSVGIAGTHGKTSTASMLGTILTEAGLQPTLVIGGIVQELQSNTISGAGNIIVVEADEFDRTFLSLRPTMCAITNLDLEHLDCYENIGDLQAAFTQFANAVPFYGRVALSIDHPNVLALLPGIKRPVITYGFTSQADIQAQDLAYSENSTQFTLLRHGENLGQITLNIPGLHNVNNALAAICIALELDVPESDIQAGLKKYSGVKRRFEIRHELKDGTLIVDDYAHHPSEVKATLQAARAGWKKRIIAVFQPHLYSRTRDFHLDFAREFLNSDVLVVTDIYPAREEPIPGIEGRLIADNAREFGHKNVYYVPDQTALPELIGEIVRPDDMIIVMGAGNIWRQIEKIYQSIGS